MTTIEKANNLTDKIKASVSEYNELIYNLTNELKLQDLEIEELKNKLNNLQEENEKLKQPQIFIDTMDMEERYGQELYEDYLKEQLEDYKSRNEKAIEYIKEHKVVNIEEMYSYVYCDKLLNILEGSDKDEENNNNPMFIDSKQMKILLDYITNLQEENNYYFKKNNELSTLNTSLRSDRDDYKLRIDKAVEYIKTNLVDEYDIRNGCCVRGSDLPVDEITPILNILEGSDKDE